MAGRKSRVVGPRKMEGGRVGNYSFPQGIQGKKRKVNLSETERSISSIGGTAMALYGIYGLSKKNFAGIWLGLLGGYMAYRGVTGYCSVYDSLSIDTADPKTRGGILVEKSIVVNRSAEELYKFWSDFENLPSFMDHLESVWMTGDHRWHWVAKAPAGLSVEWDADVVVEHPGELIAWQSTADSEIPNEGSVQFITLPNGSGTKVRVSLIYYPPAGKLGQWIAKMFGEEPELQIADDLKHFKQIMESGDTTRTTSTANKRKRK